MVRPMAGCPTAARCAARRRGRGPLRETWRRRKPLVPGAEPAALGVPFADGTLGGEALDGEDDCTAAAGGAAPWPPDWAAEPMRASESKAVVSLGGALKAFAPPPVCGAAPADGCPGRCWRTRRLEWIPRVCSPACCRYLSVRA